MVLDVKVKILKIKSHGFNRTMKLKQSKQLMWTFQEVKRMFDFLDD